MRKAVYHYKVPDFQGGYIHYNTPIEILDETERSYRVRFLQGGPNKRTPGTMTWIRKKNVKLIQ